MHIYVYTYRGLIYAARLNQVAQASKMTTFADRLHSLMVLVLAFKSLDEAAESNRKHVNTKQVTGKYVYM
jgi:hypothetical protein